MAHLAVVASTPTSSALAPRLSRLSFDLWSEEDTRDLMGDKGFARLATLRRSYFYLVTPKGTKVTFLIDEHGKLWAAAGFTPRDTLDDMKLDELRYDGIGPIVMTPVLVH